MFFRTYFPIVTRNVAGYVTKGNGKIGWKKAQNRLNEKLKKENLNRLL